MEFLEKLFRQKDDSLSKEPFSALSKAIFTAAHRVTKKLLPSDWMEGTEIKKEDFSRYDMLFSELLYFYMLITLRLAHGQHFSEHEIDKLQENLFPTIIEGTVEGPMGHWPEEEKAAIKAEHYQNINSAGFEYASCKGIYPTDDPLATGNSVYATLARKIEKRLGKSHDPQLSFIIISEVSEQLRTLGFPKLITGVRGKDL
jgi:hypothetical protein